MWVRAGRKRILPEFVATTKQLLTWSNSTKLRSGKVWQGLASNQIGPSHGENLGPPLPIPILTSRSTLLLLDFFAPHWGICQEELMHIRQSDVGGDSFDSLGGIGILEVADLSPLISSPWWAWIASCVFWFGWSAAWCCGWEWNKWGNRNLMWAWMPFITFLYLRLLVMWLLGLRGRGGDGATVPAGTVHTRERGQERLAPRGSQQLNCCFLLDYNWYRVLFYRDDWLNP